MCTHPQRTELEASVLSGTSIRATAKLFNVSWSALQRHLQHLPAAVAKSAEEEAQQIAACGKLPARIEELIAQIRAILKDARKKQDLNAALGAIRANLSCRKCSARQRRTSAWQCRRVRAEHSCERAGSDQSSWHASERSGAPRKAAARNLQPR
jgi:hypothetical protein